MIAHSTMRLLAATVSALALTPALAVIDSTGPIPLTADQTFDAVATGCLPDTPGVPGACYGVGKVVLVDVRTQSELDFQGGPAKVDEIVLKEASATIITTTTAKATIKTVNATAPVAPSFRTWGRPSSLRTASTLSTR